MQELQDSQLEEKGTKQGASTLNNLGSRLKKKGTKKRKMEKDHRGGSEVLHGQG